MNETARANPLLLYRDDGPVSLVIGRLHAPLPWLCALIGISVPAALAGAGVGRGALLAAVAWAVLLGGLGARDAHDGHVDWLAVPFLRTGEYSVIALTGLAGGVSRPVVFALLCAIAFHDYDTVDRVRQGRDPDALRFALLRSLGLGWDGRLLLVVVAYASHVTSGVFIAMTAYLWVLFAAESASGWLRRAAT
jgi:hypothetical protein